MPTSLRVLIVEDSDDDTILMVNRLMEGGYDVQFRRTETEQDFLAALDSEPWDIILADYVVPRLSAPHAFLLAKNRLPEIPFVIVSGTVGGEIASAILRAGADSFVSKDNIDDLVTAVRRALQKAETRNLEPFCVGKTLKALIAEDSEDDALLTVAELEKGGFEVQFHVVDSADSMRKALQESPWDVVISDFLMPGFGGREALEVLNESGQDLPFILTSGQIGEANAVEIMKAGAHDFVPKRNFSRLVEAIHRELRNFQTRKLVVLAEKAIHELIGELDKQVHQRTKELREANEKLQISEAKFRTLVEQVPAILYTAALDEASTTLYVSPQVECLLGFSQTDYEFDHNLWQERLHPDDLERVLTEVGQCHESGEPLHTEYRMIARDGRPVWFLDEASVVSDSTGHPLFLQGLMFNISDRKKLEESSRLLSMAVEQSAESIVITDRDGYIRYVNPTFEKMTGYSSNEVKDQNLLFLKHEELNESFYDQFWQTIASGQVWSGRFLSKRKDGTVYNVHGTITPIRDESGEIVNFVGVQRDVTLEVQLQEALIQAQKMEAVGTLAGGIAHDFNNLLTVIFGYSELLLLKTPPGAKNHTELQTIKTAAQRGADLVKQILAFGRKLHTSRHPLSLNNEVELAQKLLCRVIPKMIRIDLNLAKDLKYINADPIQLEQLLLNFAVNAKDAMPEQGGVITVSTKNVVLTEEHCQVVPDARPGAYVVLEFSDTGTGMQKDVRDRIFEPFFTTKNPGEGTGLGLAMVFGIVQDHGGRITCESEPGVGTTFQVYFPAIVEEEEIIQAGAASDTRGGDETILLIDDEVAVMDLGKTLLSMAGYHALTASNGKEGIELYRANKDEIALVVLDLIMPEMGGIECLHNLVQINPNVKVLLASGLVGQVDRNKTAAAGSKGFVQKPYSMSSLLAKVREVLDAK